MPSLNPSADPVLKEITGILVTKDPKFKAGFQKKEDEQHYLTRVLDHTYRLFPDESGDAEYEQTFSESAKDYINQLAAAKKAGTPLPLPPTANGSDALENEQAQAEATTPEAEQEPPKLSDAELGIEPDLVAKAAEAKRIMQEYNRKRREAKAVKLGKTPTTGKTAAPRQPRPPKPGFTSAHAYKWLVEHPNATVDDLVRTVQEENARVAAQGQVVEKPLGEATCAMIHRQAMLVINTGRELGKWID